jgi:hypothetical protein
MSFLAPWFLFGAFAVALPIVFHLIRRTSKERQAFSSLMFLQPTPPRMTRRSRLENIFLLLLRCLVFCLLAAGFARPFLQKPASADPDAVSAGQIALLIDRSASMRREGLWEAALEKARQWIDGANPSDQLAVYTFDREVRPVVTLEQWNAMSLDQRKSTAAGRLADAQPGWASTHLGVALTAGAEALADADKQERAPRRKRLVVITDLQEGARLDGLQGYEWPRGIEVTVEALKPRRPTNAGLQWVADLDEFAKPAGDAPPRVRVSNSVDATREQFQVRWEGVPGAAPQDVYVPPGQSRIVQAPKPPPDTVGERLLLTGDDEAFDNLAYLVRPRPEKVTLLFLGDDADNDPAALLYYLKRAFQQTRRQDVQVVARAAGAALTAGDLAGSRFVVATTPLSEDRVSVIREFLAGGGTVLFVARDASAARAIAKWSGAANVSLEEAKPPGYSMFGQVDFEHPLFAPFADPRFSDFTKVHFWKYRRLGVEDLAGARVPARFDGGDPLLVDLPVGKGSLLILTAGWFPADSQLALSSKFVPLLYSMLEQATGARAEISHFRVGDEVALSAVGADNALTLRRPDGSTVPLTNGMTRFSQTDVPGIYTVESQPPVRFAVNLDAAESKTAPLPVEELERLKVPMKPRDVELSRQQERKRRLHNAELENQQKLWRWLIVAALVVLMLETWLAGWLTRRTGSRTEVAA